MAKAGPDENRIKQFILLSATGDSKESIMEQVGISQPTYYNWKKKYAKEITAKVKEIKGGEKDSNNEKNDSNKDSNNEKTPEQKKEEKPKEPQYKSIEVETTTKSISKASDSVSNIVAKEIETNYKASQVLAAAKVRYFRNVQEIMGLHWEEFLAIAIDTAYEKAIEAYMERLSEQMYENTLLQMEIVNKLEQDKPENLNQIKEVEENE